MMDSNTKYTGVDWGKVVFGVGVGEDKAFANSLLIFASS